MATPFENALIKMLGENLEERYVDVQNLYEMLYDYGLCTFNEDTDEYILEWLDYDDEDSSLDN